MRRQLVHDALEAVHDARAELTHLAADVRERARNPIFPGR